MQALSVMTRMATGSADQVPFTGPLTADVAGIDRAGVLAPVGGGEVA